MPSRTRPISNPFGSMRPTIREGEMVLVDFGHYGEHSPRRGDLAVFLSPHDEKRLLKRVIGLPGERVEIRHGRAVIDGEAGDDRWAHVEGPPLDLDFSAVVPAGHLFVLGDNRNNSRDSRSFGFVEEGRLLGRAEAIYFSRDLDRIGRPLTD
jgi:signal peptidase I